MIVLYAEKEDMGIQYAAALGGIPYKGKRIETDELPVYSDLIKKEIANKQGFLRTTYKGHDYVITWGWGHFGTLKNVKDYNPDIKYWNEISLPFVPKKFEVKRREAGNEFFRKRDDRQFAIIKKIFNDNACEYIINGTDWEREGELIFAYVYDLTGTKKPYKRLRANSKTQKQIREDMDNLVDPYENKPYVMAARGRSIADWVVGINMTISATVNLAENRGDLINIGRVQTPTLSLVVQREEEILNFKKETTYGISGKFSLPDKKTVYTGKMEMEESFKNKEMAEKFCKEISSDAKIVSIKKTKKNTRPPLLHNTQTLQQEAESVYGFTLKQTDSIAQSLYEKGFTTYPRVDSQYLTEDKKAGMSELLSGIESCFLYKGTIAPEKYEIPDYFYNDKKVEGHDAIITTEKIPNKKDLTEDETAVYDLIARRMIMATCSDMVMEKTVILTNADIKTEDNPAVFKTTGTVILKEGFSRYQPKKKEEEKDKEEDAVLDGLKENTDVTGVYSVTEQVSKPKQRYTEGTLVKAMENCARRVEDETAKKYLKKSKGIGRPATRTNIIERLIQTEFIERKGKRLAPTAKGMHTIRILPILELKTPLLTASWEEDLDNIENSDPDECVSLLQKFIGEVIDKTGEWCHSIEDNKISQKRPGDTGLTCPVCGRAIIQGKKSKNYFCEGYFDEKNKCVFGIRGEISGKRITNKMAEDLVTKGQTQTIKGFKSKAGNSFSARLAIENAYVCENEDCKTVQTYGMDGRCYRCKEPLIPLKNRKLIAMRFEERKTKRKRS